MLGDSYGPTDSLSTGRLHSRAPGPTRRPRGVLRNYNASKALNLLDFGSPGWIRTSDHPINSRMLYR